MHGTKVYAQVSNRKFKQGIFIFIIIIIFKKPVDFINQSWAWFATC